MKQPRAGGPGLPGFGMGRGGPAAAGPGGPLASPLFPTHPFARGPRDYFMVDP